MSKSKLTLNLVFLILCFIITGCTQRNNNTNVETPKPNTNNENTNFNQSSDNTSITEDEYKNLLVKNYEKYISPLELDLYDDFLEILESKEVIDNAEFLIEYRTYINDNRTNIQSFEQSMSNLSIEDEKIQNINDNLVKECKTYINDLDKKENYLDVIDDDILAKQSNEFIAYLNQLLNRDEIEKNKLEDKIEETENLLGIRLRDGYEE